MGSFPDTPLLENPLRTTLKYLRRTKCPYFKNNGKFEHLYATGLPTWPS